MSILESRYDSRYDSEYKQRIQETVEYILSKKYGDVLSNIELGRILHYNIDDEKEFVKFKSMMGRIKSFLIDYGYILKSVSGIGYYILKPKQITGHCYRTYVKKSQRALDKSSYILDHTDLTELSDTRKEEFDNFQNLNKELIDSMDKLITASRYYDRKAYYDSLED